MHFNVKEEIIALTPQWKGERFEDGRPKVADKYLKALRNLTLEEVWKPIFVKGYESQFEGRLKTLHDDGRKLIGRAVIVIKILARAYIPNRAVLLGNICSHTSRPSRNHVCHRNGRGKKGKL